MSRSHRVIAKATVVCVVLSFTLNSPWGGRNSCAQQEEVPSGGNGRFDVEEVNISEEFGSVAEVFKGKSDKSVVFIQDTHGNFEVQKNCARIIRSITKKFQADKVLINLEGASGFIDTSTPGSIPQREIREYVNEYFMSQGQISGAEYFSIIEDRPVLVYGAENRDVYEENFRSFRDAHQRKSEAGQALTRVRDALALMKHKFYPAAVVELSDASDGFDHNVIPLTDYITFLRKYAKKYRIPLDEFPNMRLVLRVMDQEYKIDGAKVDRDRELIIDLLQKKLTAASMAKVIRRTLHLRAGEISRYAYYQFLLKAAKTCRIDTARYAELNAYVAFMEMNMRIDKEKLLEEFGRIEMKLKNRLCARQPERDFDGFCRDFRILGKLMSLTLSRKEFEYYKKNKESFAPKRFSLFFEKNAREILSAARRPAQQKAVLEGMLAALPAFEKACASLPLFERFYRLAVKRDRIIFDNVITRMQKEKVPYSILVTGGFHMAGITSELKARGISYVVVVPKMTDYKAYNPYLAVMMGEQNVFQKFLEKEAIGLAIPSIMQKDTPLGAAAQKAFILKNALLAHILTVLCGLNTAGFEEDWKRGKEKIMEGFTAEGRMQRADLDQEMREFISVMDLVRIVVSKIEVIEGGVCIPFRFTGMPEWFYMAIGAGPLFSRLQGVEKGFIAAQNYAILTDEEYRTIEQGAQPLDFDAEWSRVMDQVLAHARVEESS